MEQLVLEVIGNFGSEELLLQDDREVSSICKLPYTQSRRLAPTPCASCLLGVEAFPIVIILTMFRIITILFIFFNLMANRKRFIIL